MISSVSIQGFKSFKSLNDFSLRPLNVLIGPNRSGKTNFLDFWDLLSQAGKQQLPNAINKRGGIDSVMSWDQNPSLAFELNFAAQAPFAQETGIFYEAAITRQQWSYAVSHERLAQKPRRAGSKTNLLNMTSGKGLLYNHATEKLERRNSQFKNTDLAIAQIRDAVAYPTFDKLRRYLTNITVHRPFNTDEDTPIRNAQLIGVWDAELPSTRLSRNGDNLTNVLYAMHNEPKYQAYYDEYLFTLQRAFPSFEQLLFPAGGDRARRFWRGKIANSRVVP